MRWYNFVFFLIITMTTLGFVVAHIATGSSSLSSFFYFYNLVLICNFVYYLMMCIYTFKWDHGIAFQEHDQFFRDVFFQILFIVNGGIFVLFPLLIYLEIVLSTKTTNFFFFYALYVFIQFIFFWVDLQLIRRSHGGYTSSQVSKFAFILVLVLTLLSLIHILNSNGSVGFHFLCSYIIYFAGLGIHSFFLKLRVWYDCFSFKSSRTVTETSYYRSEAYSS